MARSKRQNAASQPAKFGIDHFFARHRASQPAPVASIRGKQSELTNGHPSVPEPDGNEVQVFQPSREQNGTQESSPEAQKSDFQHKRIRLSPLLPQTQTQDDAEEVVWRVSPTAERLQANLTPSERVALRPCRSNVCAPRSKISPGIASKLDQWLSSSTSPLNLLQPNKENVAYPTKKLSLSACERLASPLVRSKTTDRASRRKIMRKAKSGTHKRVLLELLDQVETVLTSEKPLEGTEELTAKNDMLAEAQTECQEHPAGNLADNVQEQSSTIEHRADNTFECAPLRTDQSGKCLHTCYLVLEVSEASYWDGNHVNYEKILRLFDEGNATEKMVHLRDEWCSSQLRPGDTIGIVGNFLRDSIWIIDHDHNILVTHPDTLVSGTRVASSLSCVRRAILEERVKSPDVSYDALMGTMLHRLFQFALREEQPHYEGLQNRARHIVADNIDNLYAAKGNEKDALSKMVDYIPALLSWLSRYKNINCASEPNVDFGMANGKHNVAISEVVDIEEMIWSPQYGLKGSIDASVKARCRGGSDKPIPLEFKTGKSQTLEHRAQVILYTLLLSDRYSDDVNEGLLYYLNSDETQGVKVQRADVVGLMTKRNEVASSLLRASTDRHLPPMLQSQWMCQGCRVVDICSAYHKLVEGGTAETSGLGEFYDNLTSHLNRKHAAFLQQWDRLVDLEFQASQSAQSEMWRMPSISREEQGRCLSSMTLKGTGDEYELADGRYIYTFCRSGPVLRKRALQETFVCGDMVLLSTERGHTALASGTIASISCECVKVSFLRPLKLPGNKSVLTELWRIDKDNRGMSFAMMRYNLLQLFVRDGARHTRQLVVDLEPPRFTSYVTLTQEPSAAYVRSVEDLNDDQRSAIQKILTAEDYALILGMPGTGKTSTIVHAVKALIARGSSVLLASYTNSAVDNILLKLKTQGVDFLRVGRIEAIHPELIEHTLNGVTSVEELRTRIESAQVVGATCYGISHALFRTQKFDVCIIDEAGQINLPTCLGPLRYARTFVLVGDHYQLPPLVQNSKAREEGMAISLFRRLSEAHPLAVSALQSQYRMCTDIMNVSNALIYGNRLRCGSHAVATARLDVIVSPELPIWTQEVLDPNRKVLFLDTDAINAQERCSSSGMVRNITESSIAIKIICSLRAGGVDASAMGVISPYKSQADYIARRLDERWLSGVEVLTVDKYQGRDKDCILVSFVRSKGQRISGSLLTDWRRINVAITRAKRKLILIGSASTLSSVPLLKQLIDQVSVQGGLLSLPEDTLTSL